MHLRTRIYIDGYNLYYGCLKGTPYKWLDLVKLFEDYILPTILYQDTIDPSPAHFKILEEASVKFFTAKILENAAKAADSVSSQAVYHNALATYCGKSLKIIEGKYSIYPARQALINQDNPRQPPKDCEQVEVWKLEEKQSDVNLALHLYDDAMQGEVDHVVLVTNDTDLVPAFEMLKARCPNVIRGLVVPTRMQGPNSTTERPINASLSALANWTRSHITTDELRLAQLPRVVQGQRRASIKPVSWYAKPEHVNKMIELAMPVMGKQAKILSWAHKPSEWLDGATPIDLLETDEGAQKVFDYIEYYKKIGNF